ncbi:putative phage abortive infection protein [uncultured Vagococcus sp.]|uniref:putative phage abortive infection protein n=1 Tax=uncultured Vagococcus sp. TaxID=189676 RepID=UPI0028D72746|nr:putative phage abortive infection protein [uncultured Vagococcus sp.]
MTEKKSSYEKFKNVTIGDIIDKSKQTLTIPQQSFQQTSRQRQFIYKTIIAGVIALIAFRFLFFGTTLNPWLEALKLTVLVAIPVLLWQLFNRLMISQTGVTRQIGQGATGEEFYHLLTLFNQKKVELNSGTDMAKALSDFVQTSEDLPILAETAMDQNALAEMKRQIRETLNENQPEIEDWLASQKLIIDPFFHRFQTIITLLNQRREALELDGTEYHRYIGILRSQLSEGELYLIFIYSLFSLKGVETGIDLSYTSFFGDEGQIKDNVYLNLPAVMKDIAITHFVAHTDEQVSSAHRQEMREAYQESRSLQQNYLKRTSY